jgi:hypothetical protein
VREGRGCRQGGHHQSEHEHSESCHVAAPPCETNLPSRWLSAC